MNMTAAAVLRAFDCIRNLGVPQAPKWQRIGDQIEAAVIFARHLCLSDALEWVS
jgi:hypothetical protein